MNDDVLARFVGQMSVDDLCGRLGCSVEELVARSSSRTEPPTPTAAAMAKPIASRTPDMTEGLMALPLKEARAEFERRYLQRMVELCGGNRAEASRRSGMCRSATYVILNRPQSGASLWRNPDRS